LIFIVIKKKESEEVLLLVVVIFYARNDFSDIIHSLTVLFSSIAIMRAACLLGFQPHRDLGLGV